MPIVWRLLPSEAAAALPPDVTTSHARATSGPADVWTRACGRLRCEKRPKGARSPTAAPWADCQSGSAVIGTYDAAIKYELTHGRRWGDGISFVAEVN
jgi:hypothetical protein